MITIHDLRDLKNAVDVFSLKNIGKNDPLTLLKQEQLKDAFVKAAKLYYGEQSLNYVSAIKMYNIDINKLNIESQKKK